MFPVNFVRMPVSGKTQKSRKNRVSWVTVVIAGAFAVFSVPMLHQYFNLRSQDSFYRHEVLRLEKENERLVRDLEQMNKPYFVEKTLRQLGFMKKGEVKFNVKEQPNVSR